MLWCGYDTDRFRAASKERETSIAMPVSARQLACDRRGGFWRLHVRGSGGVRVRGSLGRPVPGQTGRPSRIRILIRTTAATGLYDK